MNTLSTGLPRSPASVCVARRLVNGHTPSLDSLQRRDAVLMVSELVTNAVLHGVGAISLRIDAEADTVRIEVADEGHAAPSPSPEPSAHGGWGLRIVDQLADDWGVFDGSTKVWFRLGRPHPRRRPAVERSHDARKAS
jgi:anti-sigma regulatory factor (Ser/Thr protein kinase)